ncbi:exonuclease V isoform X2 [Esox lucius]|uniref:exonuclease V isoform X2 n=1 Tax=Esox lucius TaxID=8010 RepID=UPI001476F9B1|nr:exonuclease V isoform X2 [Esox lucius]
MYLNLTKQLFLNYLSHIFFILTTLAAPEQVNLTLIPGHGTIVTPGDMTSLIPDEGAIVTPGDMTSLIPDEGAIVTSGDMTSLIPEGDMTSLIPDEGAVVTPGDMTSLIPEGDMTSLIPDEGAVVTPGDMTSLIPNEGTNETPSLVPSNSLSTATVCVGDDGQTLAKTEEMINGLIKKRPHLSRFERLSKNRSAACLTVPDQTPMERFNKRHLSVTQLCEQSWCEIKVIYGFLQPHVKRREMKKSAVITGSSIHLARELEANPDAVTFVVQTREDREALKLMKLTQMVSGLKAGQLVREFPVFGVLEGVFFLGVVDELYHNESGELVLKELKTRSHNSLPHPAQSKGHFLQVGLYKLLFDSMVQGSMTRLNLLQYLKLQPHQAFGSELQIYAQKLGLPAVTFGELVDHFLNVLNFCNLQAVNKLTLEYIHQRSGSLVGSIEVEFNEAQLRAELRGYLAFWRGQREPQGVDVENIEEAWKCSMCPYEESCDWRTSKLQEVIVDGNKKTRFDGFKSGSSNSKCYQLEVPQLEVGQD